MSSLSTAPGEVPYALEAYYPYCVIRTTEYCRWSILRKRDKVFQIRLLKLNTDTWPITSSTRNYCVSSGESRLHRHMPEEARNTDTERCRHFEFCYNYSSAWWLEALSHPLSLASSLLTSGSNSEPWEDPRHFHNTLKAMGLHRIPPWMVTLLRSRLMFEVSKRRCQVIYH
jgi:hypothetical protein